MDNGWVKLHRDITKWEWYTDQNTLAVFIYFLIHANYKDRQWRGTTIKKGQLVTSLAHLAEMTGGTIQRVRTSLEKLKSTHEVTYESTRHYSLITLLNWEEYQSTNTATNTQITTTKEVKKINNKEKKDKEKKYGNYVKMTEKEYDTLCGQYNKDRIDGVIDSMDSWCDYTGKRYKKYASAVRQWLKKDGVKKEFEWDKYDDYELADILKERPDLLKQAEAKRPTALHLSRFI